ncbi:hypothetical protein [Tahibacter amnicola]|uniref:Pre-peptidase n=1 Tax=Tahibacter amnicola TaxID=2976241 RepID=A0ABY6BBK3_9GAMM|nr:hypothetical protein [Tahibacter amnicola]UXI66922.1 hypothetical protein N4264_19510 [Tahibacter amnicola]
MNKRVFLAASALALSNVALAAPTIGLQSGQSANFTIPAGNFSTTYYIDVTASTEQLAIDLDNVGAGDTDVMLRYGQPFADSTAAGAAPDYDLFLQYAHYRGVSQGADESLIVQKSSTIPLRAGRWYLAVINGANSAQNVRLTATLRATVPTRGLEFEFDRAGPDCDIAPWNDTTPVTAVDGNPGTTRGEQRRNALMRAGELLSQQLQSPSAVRVRACWEAQGGSPEEGATIAYAGPTNFIFDSTDFPSPWLPDKYTWYAISEVVRLSGTTQCGAVGGACGDPEIRAVFNTDLDPPNNVLNAPFYYGYTGASKPQRSIDFISTSMHELIHGLGFVGLVNVDDADGAIGERASTQSGVEYDDIFDKQLVYVNTADRTYAPFLSNSVTDAQRAAALVSQDGLRWAGAEAVASEANANRNQAAPDSFPLMFAPCERDAVSDPCATTPGSTLSHTVQAGDLMNAYDSGESNRSMGLALPMLHALGWSYVAAPARTYTAPISGNWFDRTRNGHGIDFQLFSRDAVNGDLYFVVFYTFDSNGAPEWYIGLGRLVDGVFIGAKESHGISLQRLVYNASTHSSQLDTSSAGHMVIDFNQAASSPSCRTPDRSGLPRLGVMSWTIRNESAKWCIEPVVQPEAHTTPDFAGHWYGGTADPGWGMEVVTIKNGTAQPTLVAILYYPDSRGFSRWAIASGNVNLANTGTMTLTEVTNGYCRTCTPPATPTQTRNVGTIQFQLTAPTRTDPPDGANRVTININIPGTAQFARTNVPLTLLSAPPGL